MSGPVSGEVQNTASRPEARLVLAEETMSQGRMNQAAALEVEMHSNNSVNATACGAFLLPPVNCRGGARVKRVEPPAARYAER